MESLTSIDWADKLEKVQDWALIFIPQVFGALVVLIIGLWVVKRIMKVLEVILNKSQLGPELGGFFLSMASIALKFLVVLVAASVLGFNVAALVGVFAGVIFAVGLALQGFMGNFASGITIIFFKPYKVGDWVQIGDFFGRVDSIQIFNTILITPGDKTYVIPNGKVTEDTITNFSTQGNIRLELSVTMPYEESFPRVKEIINNTLNEYDKILKDPAPIIGIESFDSHNIIVTIRPYIHPNNYWDVTFDLHSKVKEAFHQNDIKVAYSEGVELGKIGA